MAGGFASPSILFLNSWNQVEREFMQQAATKLYRTGAFTRAVEPCAGGFAMSGVFRESGFPKDALEASDVNLFSAIVGTAMADADLSDLGVRVDGKVVPLTGDVELDAAILLYEQCLARMQAKPNVHYWREIVLDLTSRRDPHIEKLAYYVKQLRDRFTPGLSYVVEPMWDHMRRISDDPHALILLNPPSYTGGYERFFDTKSRLTWDAEVEYEVWDPARDLPKLVEESAEWAATLLCLHLAPHGHCVHPDPVYAHDKRRGANDYIWSNHPDVIREAIGGDVSRTRTIADHQKLDNPILPHDYEITPDSEVGVVKMTSRQTHYYKDLWIHRLDFANASCEFGLIIDGHIAGMAGFAQIPLGDEQQSLSMLYAVGPPHDTFRLTRLVKMLALTRGVLNLCMNPWFVVTAERVVTKNWTKHPEAKGQRGIMVLLDRKTHPQFGYELSYSGQIVDRTVQATFDEWIAREKQWQQSQQPAKPKRQRRSRQEQAA